jgi:UDP-N-acetylglucosamine 2-epimerase (non-hydrolysing)
LRRYNTDAVGEIGVIGEGKVLGISQRLKVLVVFGTRPEAIKLAPVIQEMRKRSWALPVVCVTGQHREMVDQMVRVFDIAPDLDLNVMTRRQSLHSITAKILMRMREALQEVKPHLVMVQGDTTTTFAASLAAFYEKLPVAHIEAGLRTLNRFEPFPEEMNRRLADSLAEFHFAATEMNRRNLLKEGIAPERIFVVGNTVVDALRQILKYNRKRTHFPDLPDLPGKKIIAVTAHRRESFGKPLENICRALLEILELDNLIEIIYPVHLNPNVSGPVRKLLAGNKRIHLLPPLDYFSFIELLSRSELILTDSGGVQEEAPTLRKPVLLLRNVTERPEGVKAGFVRIVGTDTKKIVKAAQDTLKNPNRSQLVSARNPYGDGHSAQRIVTIIGQRRNELL